jgi:POT family proton-dependent oligopeptide transporter
VASFVGDQFDQTNKHKAKLVFDAFYWIINFGSFFASLLMPMFLRDYGPSVAFGIPGILMLAATIVFWLGAKKYVHAAAAESRFVQQRGPHRPAGRVDGGSRRPGGVGVIGALYAFYSIPEWGFVIAACTALVLLLAFGGIGIGHAAGTRGIHPDEAVEGVRAVLRILVVFACHAVLVAVRPEGLDLDRAGQHHGKTKLVPAGADAGAEPDAGDAADPVQQPGAVPDAEPLRPRRRPCAAWAGIALSSLAWIVIGLMQLGWTAAMPSPSCGRSCRTPC